MASAASPSARSASLAAALASSCCARLSILALTSSILAAASAFICAHLLRALAAACPADFVSATCCWSASSCVEKSMIPPCLASIAGLAARKGAPWLLARQSSLRRVDGRGLEVLPKWAARRYRWTVLALRRCGPSPPDEVGDPGRVGADDADVVAVA